jgi:hypothetical protein
MEPNALTVRLTVIRNILYFAGLIVFLTGVLLIGFVLTRNDELLIYSTDYRVVMILSLGAPVLAASAIPMAAGAVVHALMLLEQARNEDALDLYEAIIDDAEAPGV